MHEAADPQTPHEGFGLPAVPRNPRVKHGRRSTTKENTCFKGIPKCLFGQVFFGGLGYQGQQIPHFPKTAVFLALPPKAAKPNKQLFLKHVVLWPWYPRRPKNHLAKKRLRDPSENLSQDKNVTRCTWAPGIPRSRKQTRLRKCSWLCLVRCGGRLKPTESQTNTDQHTDENYEEM